MKLIKCYVENFGILSNYTLTVSSGMTTVHAENGSGKTTLCVFLKAMFFGLPSARKKNLDEKEREKYFPWQGGNYGGFIDFSVGQREYRVQRYFGKTPSGDSFKLYDLPSMTESNDFDENIGVQLFGVDEDAFMHTTYLPQRDIGNEKPKSLSAKICDLFDNDIEGYDAAEKRLKDKLSFLTKKSDNGAIVSVNNDIHELQRKISQQQEDEESAAKINDEIAMLCERKKAIEKQIADTRNTLSAASSAESDRQKKKSYELMLENIKKTYSDTAKINEYFGGNIPSAQDISELKQNVRNIERLKLLLLPKTDDEQQRELDGLTAFFDGKEPSKNELDEARNRILKQGILESNINNGGMQSDDAREKAELDEFFARGVPSGERLDEIKEKARILCGAQNVSDASTSKKALIIGLIVSVALMILGAVLAAVSLIACICLCGLGFFALIMVCVKKMISSQGKAASKADLLQLSQEVTAFVRDYYTNNISPEDAVDDLRLKTADYKRLLSLQKNCEDILAGEKKQFESVKGQNDLFFKRFFYDITRDEREMLDEINNKLTRFNTLKSQETASEKDRLENTARLENEMKTLEKRLGAFGKTTENAAETIAEFEMKKSELNLLNKQLDEKKKSAASYYESEKIGAAKEVSEDIDLDELKASEQELQKKLNSTCDEILRLNNTLSLLCASTESLPDNLSAIDSLKERLEDYSNQAAALKKTVEFLQQSRDSLTRRYMKGTHDCFLKYFEQLDEKIKSEFSIDPDLNIHIIDRGIDRSADYFSSGYKDLFDISLRLALAQSVFEKEKPFFVLDDPFVNMDDEKVKKAITLIKNLSCDNQIIYLVCHSSRAVTEE